MNEIVNKFLLVGDKFMPKMHFKQPRFTYSACGPFTKNKEKIQKFKETGDTDYIYINKLDKACFQHDMDYRDFKDLAKRTIADKVLRAFKIASNQKYDRYQRGLASMVFKFFDKKSEGSGRPLSSASQIVNNKEIYNYLMNFIRQLLENVKKRKMYASFRDNICGADLADMQLLSKFIREFRFLLCVIDIYSNYTWVIPLKYKKGVRIVNGYRKILK